MKNFHGKLLSFSNKYLVDSDTRIPADCLLDAASEMQQSPEVAILQYTAGILHVSDDFFERGISLVIPPISYRY